MRKFLFTLTILIPSLLCANVSSIIYVSENGTGAGSSWQDATGDLQQALTLAKSGDQIWVSQGTYVPTTSDDRNISFVIKDGVALYGGFEGKESSIEQRDIDAFPTILSGEIGNKDSLIDNSFTIIYTEGVSAATIVDGFTITKGYADEGDLREDKEGVGSAWFNNASKERVSSPTIVNCTFSDNFAFDGAALYLYAEEGECTSLVENCSFINNEVDGDGASIYNNGTYGICSPIIRNCEFIGNSANYAAGILNHIDTEGEVKPLVESCVFKNNISLTKGSVMYDDVIGKKDKAICKPIVVAAVLTNNGSTIKGEFSDSAVVKTQAEYNKGKEDKEAAKKGALVMSAKEDNKKVNNPSSSETSTTEK